MTVNAEQALRDAAARLGEASDTPRLDAELLMAHTAAISREELIMRLHHLAEPAGFAALVERRLAHEPVSYIVGTRAFWTLTLAVSPDVLIPRPDSETLIDAAVEYFGRRPGPRHVLDLGTGSGALLLAALDQWPGATGLGIDISEAALDVARHNAQDCGLADRATFRLGNWLEDVDDRFDLILANPPYIATGTALPFEVIGYEPHGALFAGSDGFDSYRAIAPMVGQRLAPGGMAAIEIGFDQGESVVELFAADDLSASIRNDLAGLPRCLMLTHRRDFS